MPRAARADSEYFAGTFCGGSRISVSEGSDDEHPPASLRHSEVTAVESPPSQAIPELGQRAKHCSEVPTALAREETGYVLDEQEAGSKRLSDSCELEEEAGTVTCESCSLPGNGEVLARESAAEQINGYPWPGLPPPSVRLACGVSNNSPRWFSETANVCPDVDSRESGGEDLLAIGV
jgi:hypothetical protein